LLSIGHDEMTRNFETEDTDRGYSTAARALIIGSRSIGAVGEARKDGQAWNIGGVDGSRGWQRIRSGRHASGEECAQTSRCTAAEGNRQNRRLEAELINGADILTHVVDSIPAADRRSVMPENIPGETNSRSPPSRRVVAESGTAGRPGKPGHIQPACALRINEGIATGVRQV